MHSSVFIFYTAGFNRLIKSENNMTEELIRRFFNKECTPEEAELVTDFLKANPSILEKYLGKEEWNAIDHKQMPDEFWNNVWTQIQEKRKPAMHIRWIRRAAVAAGLILIAGVGYNYFLTQPNSAPLVVQIEENKRHLINTMNTSQEIMQVNLPDSSIVLLTPGSVITYNTPFDNDKRDVQLEGEARFIVKKDKTKPFTVFAGDLATTALGTEFTINTKATGSKSISVKLHKGKVVIKQTGNITKAWKEDVYLAPGEQLEYDPFNMLASVTKIKDDPNKIISSAKTKTKQRKKETTGDDLVFTSSPLAEVIAELEKHFHTNIKYDSAEISAMNFTGTISQSDSLPIVLKVIAQMNELELTHENDGFKLSKQ